MRTLIYVVSDLHLGGAPGENNGVGFQMCPPRNQQRFVRFIQGREDFPARAMLTPAPSTAMSFPPCMEFLISVIAACFSSDGDLIIRASSRALTQYRAQWAAWATAIRG
jgi:hypothetical protein